MTDTTIDHPASRTANTPPTYVMPEPPDGALVGLFDPEDEDDVSPPIYRRDDSQTGHYDGDEPVWLGSDGVYDWAAVLQIAVRAGRQVVRLYREDDPAVAAAVAQAEQAGAR